MVIITQTQKYFNEFQANSLTFHYRYDKIMLPVRGADEQKYRRQRSCRHSAVCLRKRVSPPKRIQYLPYALAIRANTLTAVTLVMRFRHFYLCGKRALARSFYQSKATEELMDTFRVGIVGATGMVGQRFVTLLEKHPWFTPTVLLASVKSAGKTYKSAVEGKWAMSSPIPAYAENMIVLDAEQDAAALKDKVDFIFCAVNMKKAEIQALEEKYARLEIPVISNNSAHRFTDDVPMVIPEINPEHLDVIPYQRKRLGTKRGFIAVKSNCSLQSYVPLLHPLLPFGIKQVAVCTYQAISGAGKTFTTMPEIVDNIIPYIGGEEEKSQQEPLKIWGSLSDGKIVCAQSPLITAQCLRVPVSDGHTAAVFVSFEQKPEKKEILRAWSAFKGAPQELKLPSAPEQFIKYLEEDDRPQPKLDRDYGNGMGVCAGRLREDEVFDYKFIGLSHNTLRGAAGGAVLLAELLAKKGYLN